MIFFLSYFPLIITPLGGLILSGSSLFFLDQVHPLQLLRRSLSVIADDEVVAVLECRVLIVEKPNRVYLVMGPPYKPMNHIGLIYSDYISLSLRWCFI